MEQEKKPQAQKNEQAAVRVFIILQIIISNSGMHLVIPIFRNLKKMMVWVFGKIILKVLCTILHQSPLKKYVLNLCIA